jgi:two-component system, OmpR family, response regulator
MLASRGRVLIVDDDPDWVEVLSDFLVEEGYSVTTAPNGVAALESLSRLEPLVVITDVGMPMMDGRQLLARVHEQNVRIPVIVVTGEHAPGKDARLAGALRIIRKPVPVNHLLSAIAEAVAHRVVHLPLQKLWRAAGAVSRMPKRRVARSRWSAIRRAVTPAAAAPFVALILLAASLALLKHRRNRHARSWRGAIDRAIRSCVAVVA